MHADSQRRGCQFDAPMAYFLNAIGEEGNGKPPHEKTLSPVSRFCYTRNRLCNAVRYLNNTFATRKNLALWNPSQTSDCSFCFQPESLLHVVAGRRTYLSEGRFTWRQYAALNLFPSSLPCLSHYIFYVNLPQYPSPSLVTGDDLRPDMPLSTSSNTLCVVELSVGFET